MRMMANLQGDLEEGRRLHEKAIVSLAERWGPRHPDVARGQLELAVSLRRAGQPGAARPLLEEALQTVRQVYGSLHPVVPQTEVELATVRWMLGEESEALAGAIDAELDGHRHLLATLRTLPERQALVYAAQRPQGIDLALSIVAASESKSSLEPLWDVVIRSRAVVLDEMAARNRAVLGGTDAEVAKLAEALAAARAWTARMVVEGPDSDDPQSYMPKLEQALQRRDDAERALAQKSAAFRRELAVGQAGLPEATAALPNGSALVAFVRYDRSMLHPGEEGGEKPAGRLDVTPSYAALVYGADAGSGLRLVQLGSAERIETLVEVWRDQVAKRPPAARAASRRAEADYRKAGAALREAVWDPVVVDLRARDRVYVVPDGALHLVSFAALPDAADAYLVEGRPLLHLLSAERDLVQSVPDSIGQGLLALGSPDFDSEPGDPPPAAVAAATQVFSATGAALYRGPRAACEDFRLQQFAALPASLDEIEEIAQLWGVRETNEAPEPALTLSGGSAHEATLKRLASGRRVIHLATHGFFLGSECGQLTVGDATARGGPGETVAVGNNPLVFSGLALAGANHRDQATGKHEDGVLTAE
jgi:CHAT domain-containing protein